MLALLKAEDRGHFDHGWLDTFHSFSFGEYHDPARMGFRALRVINEDRIAPGRGFPMHGHRDMEILTYVISGALAHKDSMGNGSVIRAGEVQGMSAGTGVVHSEFNPSPAEPTHLLQIWIMPAEAGVAPGYGEWHPKSLKQNEWMLTASGNGAEESLAIAQDARLYLARCNRETELFVPLGPGRFGWVQVAEGKAEIGGLPVHAGDGASFAADDIQRIAVSPGSTLLLFDLA